MISIQPSKKYRIISRKSIGPKPYPKICADEFHIRTYPRHYVGPMFEDALADLHHHKTFPKHRIWRKEEIVRAKTKAKQMFAGIKWINDEDSTEFVPE
jgi:hypothetical protein